MAENQKALSEAVQKVKELMTSGEGEEGGQLEIGDEAIGLMNWLNETFPGAFTPNQEEEEVPLTPAERIFGKGQ